MKPEVKVSSPTRWKDSVQSKHDHGGDACDVPLTCGRHVLIMCFRSIPCAEWKVPKETKKKRAARILEAAERGELKLR
jgi:hypothetical protein